jgi:hypothetical protein
VIAAGLVVGALAVEAKSAAFVADEGCFEAFLGRPPGNRGPDDESNNARLELLHLSRQPMGLLSASRRV